MLLTIFNLLFHPIFAETAATCSQFTTPLPVQLSTENFFARLPPSLRSPMETRTVQTRINGTRTEVNYTRYPSSEPSPKGTVFFFCGGPGVPCRGIRPPNIPKEYNVVTMDYLGIGQNEDVRNPQAIAIDSQAQAALAVAEHLQEPNLIFFGQSFGTTVATAAASKFTQQGTTTSRSRLRGIMLEGVINSSISDYEKGYLDAANAAWERLSREDQQKFVANYNRVVHGLSATEKRAFEIYMVMQMQRGTADVELQLKHFIANPETINARGASESGYADHFRRGASGRQMLAAGCQIFGGERPSLGLKIFGGTLGLHTLVPAEMCRCRTVSRNWDSSEYQIKRIPILYINGTHDPATPLSGAQGHHDQ